MKILLNYQESLEALRVVVAVAWQELLFFEKTPLIIISRVSKKLNKLKQNAK